MSRAATSSVELVREPEGTTQLVSLGDLPEELRRFTQHGARRQVARIVRRLVGTDVTVTAFDAEGRLLHTVYGEIDADDEHGASPEGES